MFYTYNENAVVLTKSQERPAGENVAYSNEDFDLSLYDVTLGFISASGEILKYTKKLKSAEAIEARIKTLEDKRIESELDIDFRLSMLELGLI